MISGRMLIYAWDERQARAGKKRRLAEKHKWGKFRQLHWGAGNSSCRVSWWVVMGISSIYMDLPPYLWRYLMGTMMIIGRWFEGD